MITPLKRFAIIMCTFCMILTMCPDVSQISAKAVSQYTEQEVEITKDGQVVDSFLGIPAEYVTYSSNTGYYCCASYVSKFYLELYGVTVYNINMVDDKPSVYMSGHNVELRTVTTPLPGDIMQNKGYSHVAIVKEVDGSQVTLIEQNYKWNHWQTGALITRINRKTTATENYYYRLYIDGVEQKLDETPPTISSAKASGITGEGFTVSAGVSDVSGVSKVKIGTYLKSAGKTTAKWKTISNPSSKISQFVSTSDFDKTDDTYVTIIQAYDKFGNRSSKTLNTYVDTTPPSISNVKISGVTAKGYTVTCTVSDINGIKDVKFPTWTTKNSTDDLDSNWLNSTASNGTLVDDKATFFVDTSKHNNEIGEYNTYIYAYDTYGNSVNKGITVTINPATAISFNVSSLTIEKGQSAIIDHTLKGSNITDKVTWTTSDKASATVSNGKVVANNVGVATITAKTSAGKTAKCTVKVTANMADMQYSTISDQYYTGKAFTPAVTVKYGTQTLVKGTDYTITYSLNTNPGIAQITIKGIGLYTGTKKLTFKICPSNINGAKVSKKGANYTTLSWNKIGNASGYYVYRYDTATKKWIRIANVTSNSFKDTGLNSCTEYKYKVKAYYNSNGKICAGKATSEIKTVTNPFKSRVTLKKSNKNILVTWNAQSGVDGYEIYNSKSGKSGTFALSKNVTDVSNSSYLIKGYSGNNFVRVRAYKIVNGKKIYGIYSDVKRIAI